MSRSSSSITSVFDKLPSSSNPTDASWDKDDLAKALRNLGVKNTSPEQLLWSLPFSFNDTTGGSESELQASVIGNQSAVDLPITIRESHYFSNIIKRLERGETSGKIRSDLENYLNTNPENVWDNSWVRFPVRLLTALGQKTLSQDLMADKRNPDSGRRKDVGRFLFRSQNEECLRIPLSYLLKLALADLLGLTDGVPTAVLRTGVDIQGNFANDNTSPETHSFHVTPLFPANGNGRAIAGETGKRYLLTQLLILYANEKFQLRQSGQRAIIFHSPRPPIRQKILNDCIADSFYRELFMSPCLSGWDCGEEKHEYMRLCHEVLSRSQLNTLSKLREAGIVTRNLVILPNTSNISLANNGTHVSIGSLQMTKALKDPFSGFSHRHEKHIGDLAIKIFEHFLPLFVGHYTAAPHRLDFTDFHPEKALGFLPHELHYTHLRMIWRRWTKKARLKVFGKPVTPFGPPWLDKAIDWTFGFRGDCVPDFRLNDYLVALLSTENSSSLDGKLGNEERLKKDLMDMGVFDERMSVYLLYKLRQFSKMGFSGFEGRYYSLFEDIVEDMEHAVNLQVLITLYAFKLIAKGVVSHAHIPDSPFLESERRQITFGSGLNIPTFYVRAESNNLFLKKILKRIQRSRPSNRYKGFIRIHNVEYQKALLHILKTEAGDCIELLGMEKTLLDLESRLENPELAAASKLTRGILSEAGVKSAFDLSGNEFGLAAEKYYRNTLRLRHFQQGLDLLKSSLREQGANRQFLSSEETAFLHALLQNRTPERFIEMTGKTLFDETASLSSIQTMIYLVLIDAMAEKRRSKKLLKQETNEPLKLSSVY